MLMIMFPDLHILVSTIGIMAEVQVILFITKVLVIHRRIPLSIILFISLFFSLSLFKGIATYTRKYIIYHVHLQKSNSY